MKKYMTQNTVQNLIQREKKYFENELKENTANPKKLKNIKTIKFSRQEIHLFSIFVSKQKKV